MAAVAFLLAMRMESACRFASCFMRKTGKVYALGTTFIAASHTASLFTGSFSFFRFLDRALPLHLHGPCAVMTGTGITWTGPAQFFFASIAFTALSVLALQGSDNAA